MKTSLILPLLALFSASFAVALPASDSEVAQDNADPQSEPGDVSTQAIISGTCSSVTQQCTASNRPGGTYHAPCPINHRCGARHRCNIDTVRLTAVCS
ncbi:hypothetical protein P170DRAFT_504711 [Aspergillus steynii IBT 23096]|uniref:Uncharacterized protein n=1 Tax=Aspergillus steynii IBT 23096 TaxID=1392250 RepID=A0A2I2GLP1_9EURO|nr:uncharacterized protein P170DRAFT_504711 [Aspergillus steynii IBT 23096]PLB53794.1 hypothetical protein P170DRAFT_504711 [Aspergillus steynii IBT 23096]